MSSNSDGGKTEVILSLGSNQGDRAGWLGFATRVLAAHPEVSVVAVSHVYKTEPVDVAPAYRNSLFLNAVVVCETTLALDDFFGFTQQIENDAGRIRGDEENLPRTLDIDIILFGDVERNDRHLVVPHPRARARRFVMQPLADVRPSLRFPGDTETVAEHLAKLPKKPKVVLKDPDLLHVKELAKWNYPF